MSGERSIVRHLRDQALDDSVSVASLLRTAKVIALKLEQHDAMTWIEYELKGYPSTKDGFLPEFRRLQATVRGFNVIQGWLPVILGEPKLDRLISQAPIGQSVASLEKLLSETSGDATVALSVGPEKETIVREAINAHVPLAWVVSSSEIYAILDAVRNLILDWVLDLEREGILGEEIEFTEGEKVAAERITNQTFVAHNVSIVGDGSTVTNKQAASGSLSIESVQAFCDQASKNIDALPSAAAGSVESELEFLKQEICSKEPNYGKMRTALRSIKTIAEGVAGNLIAAGIAATATAILG